MKIRIVFMLGVLALIGVFMAPIWTITLEAAQFPEGLKMHIWINKITGSDEHILQNVNILNHYIGMKPIREDSIPELKYFPIVLYAFMGLGLVFTFLNNKWGYLIWFVLLAVAGILGVYDFYLWMYDYGHDLDPSAPIKIPGMTYMPPLIGEKDLLNFYVMSYPALGSAFLGISMFLTGTATLVTFKNKKKIM